MRALLLFLALVVGVAVLGTAHAADPLPFERGSWNKLRTAHAGQPTVIHLWGLTCGPCLVELPNWGKLLAERSDLRLVLVDSDPVPQPAEQVAAALNRAGLAKAESWSFTDRFSERLQYEIDPTWAGELPRTLLIARDGSVTALPGVADLDKVRAWLTRNPAPDFDLEGRTVTSLRAALVLLLSLLLAHPLLAHDYKLGALEIGDPWARATPPSAPAGGGFLTITNTGQAPDRLVSATSPAANIVQIHEMKMDGSVMRMREVEKGLEIPAGGSVTLAPGGYHLMMMGLKGPLTQGTSVPVTLMFEKAGKIEVNLEVGSLGATSAPHTN